MSASIHFWRRTDVEGLERLELAIEPEGVRAKSTVICLEAGGFRLDHCWQLDAEWRAQFVTVERWNSQGHGILHLERAGAGWRVDGKARPDLEGAEEPDLSVTPFCNTFPIRRTPEDAGASVTLDTTFIDGPALTVARSRQRYDRQGLDDYATSTLASLADSKLIWWWTIVAWCCATSTFSSGCSYLPDTETALHWPTCFMQSGSRTSGAVMPAEMDAKAASPA